MTTELQTAQSQLIITNQQIEHTNLAITQAEKLVQHVLEPDIDFGLLPGTNSKTLFDCGAAKIANAFNSYPEHSLLHYVENDEMISCIIQTKLIARKSGQVVASGIGSCSTAESKYAYRWVFEDELESYGIADKNSVKYDKKKKKYRVHNPEIEDLGNTIIKMASKRSEVDAANSLPGVGSGLKKIFNKIFPKKKKDEEEGPRWSAFWREVAALNLNEVQVHDILGVHSIQDEWLAKGKSLNQAIKILADHVGKKPHIPQRDPNSITNLNALLTACYEDFNMQPVDVYQQLGYASAAGLKEGRKDFANCYIEISAIRKGPELKELPTELKELPTELKELSTN